MRRRGARDSSELVWHPNQMLPFGSISEHEQEHHRFFVEEVWGGLPYDSTLDVGNCIREEWYQDNCLIGELPGRCLNRHSEPLAIAVEEPYCQARAALPQHDYAMPGPKWADSGEDPCPIPR